MAPRRHRLQMVARGPRRSRGCLGRVVLTVGRLVEAGRPCLSGECPVRAALCYMMCCDVLCCAALLSAVLCCSKRTAAFSCVSLSCTVLHSPGMLSGVCAWTGLPRPGSMLGGMVGVKVSISKTTIEYADSENGGGDHGGESSESMVPPSPCPPFLPPWLRWLAALAIGCVSHQCKETRLLQQTKTQTQTKTYDGGWLSWCRDRYRCRRAQWSPLARTLSGGSSQGPRGYTVYHMRVKHTEAGWGGVLRKRFNAFTELAEGQSVIVYLTSSHGM